MEINVTDQNGMVHKIDAEPGVSLMLAIREAGLLIKAECGGCCLCATCHVYVAENWQGHLPPKSADEDMTLSEGCETLDSSRLACQIEVTTALDGLTLTIAPNYL
jgi:ferredoxin, 2Fe-2S